jgi:hypothetical protein
MSWHLLLILWQDEPNRWTQFTIGDTVGIDWLWLLGGTLFVALFGYGIYASLLRGLLSANWHPANFRKLVYALCFLLWIIWFEYVFWAAFGGVVLYLLAAAWLAQLIIFLVTRRKVRVS